MPLARIEFALGEFAAYEFGYESLAAIAEADFHGAGAAVVVPDSGSYGNAGFAIPGAAQTSLDGAAVIDTVLTAQAQATLFVAASSVRETSFSTPGVTVVTWEPGDVRVADFAAAGGSTAFFDFLDGPGFDIVSTGAAQFPTQVLSDHVWTVQGTSSASFVGTAYSETRAEAYGVSAVALVAQGVGNGTFSADGSAVVAVPAQRVTSRTLDIAGAGMLSAVGQSKANTRAVAQGSAVLDMQQHFLMRVYSRLDAPGAAQFLPLANPKAYGSAAYVARGLGAAAMRLQSINELVLTVAGTSTSVWLRGRQVLPNMDSAFDVVERPEELRAIERPEESRIVERV